MLILRVNNPLVQHNQFFAILFILAQDNGHESRKYIRQRSNTHDI